eukprot:6057189-Pleurochrysis_carterae.AAC.3
MQIWTSYSSVPYDDSCESSRRQIIVGAMSSVPVRSVYLACDLEIPCGGLLQLAVWTTSALAAHVAGCSTLREVRNTATNNFRQRVTRARIRPGVRILKTHTFEIAVASIGLLVFARAVRANTYLIC